MARSLSNAKIISAAISASIKSRGFCAAVSQGVAKTGAGKSPVMVKKAGEEKVVEKVAWIPDPKTGFYRPENMAEEIDVAELRAMLLKKAK